MPVAKPRSVRAGITGAVSASDSLPDLAALYLMHRDAMYRVAASVLRSKGLAHLAEDAVQDAMVSLMRNLPDNVDNWEALMVAAARRRALDIIKSAAVKHAGPELSELDDSSSSQLGRQDDIAEEVAEVLDRNSQAVVVRDAVGTMPGGRSGVLWQYIALERSRQEIATERGVTPPRISQIAAKELVKLKDILVSKGVVDR